MIEDEVEFSVANIDDYFAYFTSDKSFYNEGDSVLFTNYSYGVDTNTTYQWIFEGGTPATDTLESPGYIQYAELGEFDVTLIISNDQQSDTLVREDYIKMVGVGVDENILLNFVINPNPFYNFAEIKLFVRESNTISIKLMNQNGVIVKDVFNGAMDVGNHVVGLGRGDLARGLYYLLISTDKEQIVKKVIII